MSLARVLAMAYALRLPRRVAYDLLMVQRVEEKIQAHLKAMKSRCEKQNRDLMKVDREFGRLLGQNTRAARLLDHAALDKIMGRLPCNQATKSNGAMAAAMRPQKE